MKEPGPDEHMRQRGGFQRLMAATTFESPFAKKNKTAGIGYSPLELDEVCYVCLSTGGMLMSMSCLACLLLRGTACCFGCLPTYCVDLTLTRVSCHTIRRLMPVTSVIHSSLGCEIFYIVFIHYNVVAHFVCDIA